MSDVVERHLLVKRGLYYRPNNQGYTGLKRDAGRYPASMASETHGIHAVHEDEAGEFAPACWPETKLAERDAEITRLRAQVASLTAAVEGERELCAMAVEGKALEDPQDCDGDRAYNQAIRDAAAAIRNPDA